MRPSSADIIRFLAEKNDENFQSLIRGHLYIEALLGEIIQRAAAAPAARVPDTFSGKVKRVSTMNRLADCEVRLLTKLNKIRNRPAHDLDFGLTFEVSFELLVAAKDAGIDFSDEGIFDPSHASKCYGVAGVIVETISNTFQHIVWGNEDLFSGDLHRFLG